MCVNAALESSTANGKSPVQKSKESLSCKSPCLQNKGLSEIRGVQRPESKDTRGDERLLQVPLKSHCRNWQSCTLCELLWTSCRVFGSVSFHGHCTHSVDVLCVFKGCLSLDMNLPWDVLKQITLCYVIHHMNKMWWVVQAWTGREQHHSTVSGMDPALKRDKEFSRYHWTERERLFELCNTGRGCGNSVIWIIVFIFCVAGKLAVAVQNWHIKSSEDNIRLVWKGGSNFCVIEICVNLKPMSSFCFST